MIASSDFCFCARVCACASSTPSEEEETSLEEDVDDNNSFADFFVGRRDCGEIQP